MRLKLYQKGIPGEILDKYFNLKDEEDIIKKEKDESETARKLLEKKIGDLSKLKDMDFKEKSKLFAFLARKGFSYDIIEHLFR
jgi:SOS response regulatory protein OraA/RecX